MDKPTAEQFREMLSEALEDPRKPETQLKLLDNLFEQEAEYLPQEVECGIAEIYEQLSGVKRHPYLEEYAQENPRIAEMWNREAFNAIARKNTAEKNEAFIAGLTSGSIDPVLRIRLVVNPQVADFSDIDTEDLPSITKLPGYIKLHEAARDKNVGIAVFGLKRDEGGGQPALIIDLSKTYEEGELIPGGLRYPDLPGSEEEPAQAEQPAVRQPARLKPRIKRYSM